MKKHIKMTSNLSFSFGISISNSIIGGSYFCTDGMIDAIVTNDDIRMRNCKRKMGNIAIMIFIAL